MDVSFREDQPSWQLVIHHSFGLWPDGIECGGAPKWAQKSGPIDYPEEKPKTYRTYQSGRLRLATRGR